MKPLKTAFGPTAVLLALAIAPTYALSAEEPLIPPGNSAVNQYTETFPTSGGDKDFEKGVRRPPRQVLGSRQAQRLEEGGKDGRAAAEVAAETAPAAISPSEASAPEDTAEGAGGTAGSGGGGAGPGRQTNEEQRDRNGGNAGASGSWGFAEVLGQATGTSDSGEMGLLLPLTILAALAGSIAFLLRRSRRIEP